jgi:elongation factor G
VILEKMEFPDPVIEIAIEPKTKADQEKLGVALAKLVAEDPSFRVTTDPGIGQTIIKGMGELHLDIKVDILKRTYKVEANIGAPQVAYREKITSRSPTTTAQEADRRLRPVRASQDRGRAAAAGDGFEFENEVVGGSVPKEYIPGVEKGSSRCSARRARRLPGGRSQGDADRRRLSRRRFVGARLRDRARRRCASAAEGRPVLLEPIMKVEVVTPEDYTGSVIGDLNSRRGQIQGQDMRGNANVVNAMVRSPTCSAYVSQPGSMSRGRATFPMLSITTNRVPRRLRGDQGGNSH